MPWITPRETLPVSMYDYLQIRVAYGMRLRTGIDRLGLKVSKHLTWMGVYLCIGYYCKSNSVSVRKRKNIFEKVSFDLVKHGTLSQRHRPPSRPQNLGD